MLPREDTTVDPLSGTPGAAVVVDEKVNVDRAKVCAEKLHVPTVGTRSIGRTGYKGGT